MSRTAALNKIFARARGSLVVRLDARTHIGPNYLQRIVELSRETGAANVGGTMVPIGRSPSQRLIGSLMRHRFCFGGGKSRCVDYKGTADSVYLGAFDTTRCDMITEWFDVVQPRISEDSDLNYRLRKGGGRVYLDTSVEVLYYPRETLREFFRLCYNYGVGRGVFLIKHRAISAFRQVVPPMALVASVACLALGYKFPLLIVLLAGGVVTYLSTSAYFAFRLGHGLKAVGKGMAGFVGCHFFWTAGIIASPFVYFGAKRAARELDRP